MKIVTVNGLKRIIIGLFLLSVAYLVLNQFCCVVGFPPYILKKPPVVVFTAGKSGAAELAFNNGVPVMILRGSPQAMGEQQGHLLKPQLTLLVDTFLDRFLNKEFDRNIAVKAREQMKPFVADAYQKELEGLSSVTSLPYDRLLLLQTIIDEPCLPSCSAVLASRPATAQPGLIFGRNLDFVSLGVAEHYSLIAIYHPDGKKSFASVTWPGFVGVLSGINEDGLSLGLNLSFSNWPTKTAGIPSTMLLRRVLEEASTVDEAIAVINSAMRVSPINLAIADAKNNYAILEITADKVAVRLPEPSGVLYCTNWFVTKEMASGGGDGRYGEIGQWAKSNNGKIGLDEITDILRQIAISGINLQSMVFYPQERIVYLASGSVNSAQGKFKKVDLAPYLLSPK